MFSVTEIQCIQAEGREKKDTKSGIYNAEKLTKLYFFRPPVFQQLCFTPLFLWFPFFTVHLSPL